MRPARNKKCTSTQLHEKNTTSASATNSPSPLRPGFSTSTLILASGADRLSHCMHCKVVVKILPYMYVCLLERHALLTLFKLKCWSLFTYPEVEPCLLPP